MSNVPQPDIIDKYLINTNMPRDPNVPLEVFIAFPKTLTDPDAKEEVRKMWLYGNDKQVVAMELMFKSGLEIVFRPTGLMIDWKHLVISTYTPSGLGIVIPNTLLPQFGQTTEQRIENLNDYLYVKFHKEEDWLQAESVVPLRGKVSEDTAKEILDNSRYTPIEILLLGLGYKPTAEIKRLFIPRLLTWFKGFDGKPMHIAQFTLPETAKTTFGIQSEYVWNYKYIPEPPTLARLILDARSGILGEVFLRNGIVFDEFDKWTIDTQDRRYTFDSILTGMEQGKWERGVSAMGIRAPDVSRLIPILFFGNLGDLAKMYGITTYCVRAWFTEIYTRRLTHDVRALADRLAVIDGCFREIRIMDYLTNKVLPHSIIRGIITLLQKDVKQQNDSKLKGRLKRHSDNVYAILKALHMNIEPSICDQIVGGTYEWDKQIPKNETKEAKLPIERDTT